MYKVVRSSGTNAIVTNYYLDIIASLLDACGEEKYDENRNILDCDKMDILVTPSSVDFIKLFFKGYKNQIYWMQGIDAEESFMKHGSKLRMCFLNLITKFSIKNARAIFYVSDEMKKYVENKFSVNTTDKSFIMPCFNVSMTKKLKLDPKKYEKNVFAYVGSLSKWQCFEETLDFFKKIEQIDSNAELRIFTFAEDEAKKLVLEKKIDHCKVTSVSPDKMAEALNDVKFGFVLRENNPVNRVATPTKLSSYLSAGVIPIFSKYLVDFYNRTKDYEYVISTTEAVPNRRLLDLMTNKIDIDKLSNEYNEIFNTYYNPEYYITMFKDKMRKVLETNNGAK